MGEYVEAWQGSVALRVNNVAVWLCGSERVSVLETPPGESHWPKSMEGKG